MSFLKRIGIPTSLIDKISPDWSYPALIGILGTFVLYYTITSKIDINNIIMALIVVGFFILLSSMFKRGKSDTKDEEMLKESGDIDFEISNIHAKNDAVIDHEGIGYIPRAEYSIGINVFNKTNVKNTVKKIDVEIECPKKSKRMCDKTNFDPMDIPPRGHLKIEFKAFKLDYEGEKRDKLRVCLTTLDDKLIKKEIEIGGLYAVGDDKAEG